MSVILLNGIFMLLGMLPDLTSGLGSGVFPRNLSFGLASIILDIYFFSLLVMVIASWIAPYSNHPATTLINQLTDPICTPARKLLPPMGGLDFSIILVFVIITLIDSFLIIQPLARALGIPSGLIMGLY